MANQLQHLLDFLARLDAARIHHTLTSVRPEAVMVIVTVPGERWEVEFFTDGVVEVERFVSQGVVAGEAAIEELFATYGEAAESPND
jgi:hypothetical protein